MLTGSCLFLLLGLILIILAAIVFPTKMLLHPQPIDGDYLGVGWLFAPVIGAWGLFSTTLGLIQSSWSKLKIKAFLLPIFALALVVLLFMTLLLTSSGVLREISQGQMFWLFYISLTMIPSLIVVALTSVYNKREKNKGPICMGKNTRAVVFATSIVVPLLYSTIVYYILTLA